MASQSVTYQTVYVKEQPDASLPHAETKTVGSKTYYIFPCSVAARELQDKFNVSFKIDGTEYSIVYSPMNYCYNVLNGGTNDTNLQNVLKALYLYSEAAKDYFSQEG